MANVSVGDGGNETGGVRTCEPEVGVQEKSHPEGLIHDRERRLEFAGVAIRVKNVRLSKLVHFSLGMNLEFAPLHTL